MQGHGDEQSLFTKIYCLALLVWSLECVSPQASVKLRILDVCPEHQPLAETPHLHNPAACLSKALDASEAQRGRALTVCWINVYVHDGVLTINAVE